MYSKSNQNNKFISFKSIPEIMLNSEQMRKEPMETGVHDYREMLVKEYNWWENYFRYLDL